MIEFNKGRIFTPADYEPYMDRHGGKTLQPLPNSENVDPLIFLNDLASGGHSMTPVWGYARLPDSDRSQWTQFFLTSYMMSGCDGGGYAVTYGGKGPIVRRFAICKHSKLAGADARPNYGWHPGVCSKCGFNMSYDSGD